MVVDSIKLVVFKRFATETHFYFKLCLIDSLPPLKSCELPYPYK